MASEQQMRLDHAHAEGQESAERWANATRDSIDSAKNTASNAAESVRGTARSARDGTREAAGAFADSARETGSNAAQWGREKTDLVKESINDTTFAAREKKEFAAGFMEQTGENAKQAFFDNSVPGTTSLDRTNTPSFDQLC